MPLNQDISPLNPNLTDLIQRTGDMEWIPDQMDPQRAFFKLLWTSPEKNSFAVLLRWLKGFSAPPHKHLGSSLTFILSGELAIRDRILKAGDFVHEPTGMVHEQTTAMEDTEYLFIMEGALILFDDNNFTHYLSFEEMQRMADAHHQRLHSA